jgi:parallel beta-helix repeat protein
VSPKDGNTFIGESGTVLDGENSTDFAFRSVADNVTIRNIVVTRYAPPPHEGAIEAIWDRAQGWVIEDCEVSYNLWAGIRIGHGGIVRRCHVHHNGEFGLGGSADNGLIEDNEVSYNNTGGGHPDFAASGMKFISSEGLVVRNNHVHHNVGFGIWYDIDHNNGLIEGNISEHNGRDGILYEISYNGTIRNNTVRGNDGAGISVANSPDVEVYNNVISDNRDGILGLDANRGTGKYGVYTLTNLWAHDNTINLPQGLNGVWGETNSTFTSKNNRFDRNTYNAHTNNPFWWNARHISWAEWQANGQDPNGTFN